jgi:5-formyltetrahydrofolate cyclo-ligase
MSGDRARLRRELRDRRRALPPAARIAAAEALAARILALPFLPAVGDLGGYWAMDGEIALHAWQLRLPGAVTYCLPVLHEDGRLRFVPWKPGDPLVPNRFGIPEPDVDASDLLPGAAMALVVMPLVGFDGTGQRLGMGAGWYDRTFAGRLDAPAPPWLVGAAFAMQQVDGLAGRAWDVPLDAACTERGTHLFSPDATVRPGEPDEG